MALQKVRSTGNGEREKKLKISTDVNQNQAQMELTGQKSPYQKQKSPDLEKLEVKSVRNNVTKAAPKTSGRSGFQIDHPTPKGNL